MDSLSQETWDLVIVGTDLPQALLALSLSRSGLKILHVDKNDYYGGSDAGLSLDEVQKWAVEHSDAYHALVNERTSHVESRHPKLASSRSYTLSLNPQIIYASSPFLPALVTSRLHNQLDFLAVGSWWICKEDGLQRIPSTREDVFADPNLSRRDKMGLMKFLRSVVQEDPSAESGLSADDEGSLKDVLATKFSITPSLQSALAALALTLEDTQSVRFTDVVVRIRRHMSSMNYFGPGFAAVYPKYAGNAEIAQVACRAGAVGGATYLLGHGVSTIDAASNEAGEITVKLTDATEVKTRYVAGSNEALYGDASPSQSSVTSGFTLLRSITIVSDPLRNLFPQTADNGPTPAIAVLLIDDTDVSSNSFDAPKPPLYLQVHSEDTGECPSGQCIIYGTLHFKSPTTDLEAGRLRIANAVNRVLTTITNHDTDSNPPEALWSMTYTSTGLPPSSSTSSTSSSTSTSRPPTSRIITFSSHTQDLAFDELMLVNVKTAWSLITSDLMKPEEEGGATRGEFLCFEERRGEE